MLKIRNSKPIGLLKTLDQEAYKSLGQFLKSGYASTSKKMILLYDILSRYHPGFDQKKFTSGFLALKLFPEDTSLKEQKLRKRLSEFSKLVLHFIAIYQLEKNQVIQKRLQSDLFIEVNAPSLLQKNNKQRLSELEENPIRDPSYYLEKNSIFEQHFSHSLLMNSRFDMGALQDSEEHLDQFYFLKKLEYHCAQLSVLKIHQSPEHQTSTAEMLTHIKHRFGKKPVFKIYLNIIDLFKPKTNTPLFNTIVQDFQRHLEKLSLNQKKMVLSSLINYCFAQVRKKNHHYQRKQIELQRFGLQHDLFSINGKIPEKTFLNLTFSATLSKQFDFVEEIINNFAQKLPAQEQEPTVSLSKAFMYFHQGQYHKAYDLIFNFNQTAIHYQLRFLLLQIRCLYYIQLEDKSYLPVFKRRILAFEMFFKREKSLQTQYKKAYLNFVKVLKMMTKSSKLPLSEKKIRYLEFLNQFDSVIAAEWLSDTIKKMR